MLIESNTPDTFFCDPTQTPWVTTEGWYEILRQYVVASALQEGGDKSWELLWLYVPDYTQQGIMSTIEVIPKFGNPYRIDDPDPFWRQTDSCSGFEVNKDDCQWR